MTKREIYERCLMTKTTINIYDKILRRITANDIKEGYVTANSYFLDYKEFCKLVKKILKI